MQLLCDKYTYIIYMYTMVSPTSQSENPQELSWADRADNRWLARARESSTLLSTFPLENRMRFRFEIVRSTGEEERRKEREREAGRKNREREREENALAIVCQHLDRCTASPTLSNVHPGNPREKHQIQKYPQEHHQLPYHPSRIPQIPPKIQA